MSPTAALLLVLTVVESATQSCSDARCPPSTSCELTHGGQKQCLHKPLLPLNVYDVAAGILAFVACALAAGGGVGGGGLLVPIFILVLNFETNRATALSLATISGGSLANLFTYVQRYHPLTVRRRPLIDYDAVLLFSPGLLAGTIVGGIFSVQFPSWASGRAPCSPPWIHVVQDASKGALQMARRATSISDTQGDVLAACRC